MAFEGVSLAEVSADLKEYYNGVRLNNLMLKTNPFFSMVKKNTKVSGKVVPVPVVLSGSKGVSSNFARAQANQSAAKFKEFMVPMADDYGLVTVKWKAAEASRDDAGAFEDVLKVHCDTTLQEVANVMATKLWRRGTGTIGVISAVNTSTGVVTLKNPNDATNFDEEVILNASATEGAAPVGGAATPIRARVVSADWIGGKVTLDTEGGSAAWIGQFTTTNKYLALDGTYGSPQIVGVRGWIPDVDNRPVSGENFFGVDRTASPVQLAGAYFDARGMSVEEGVIKAAALTSKFQGRPKMLFVNQDIYGELSAEMQGRREYVEVTGASGIGFKGIEVMAEYGPIAVISDRNVEPGFGALLSMETWELKSYGGAPKFQEYEDGLIFYRRPDADAVEGRITAYSQLTCEAPQKNCMISFAPFSG